MPLDLGHHAPGPRPSLGLIAEAGVKDPNVVGRAADGTPQQVRDPLLQDRVGWQSDGVGVAFGFQELVDLGLGEGGVGCPLWVTSRRKAAPL